MTIAAFIVAIGAWAAGLVGIISQGIEAALLVVSFPVLCVGMMLWWTLGKGEDDLPFMGY
ncbi:hypothetical protein [Methanovulcanius yangii]|uniref:hypothetical protein n=1 Tax=Methanovulcanius yangii TaxID=1789227 RepID=UPI0029CA6F75|nr:hypothetical protein [Methanovulcanius yangii]